MQLFSQVLLFSTLFVVCLAKDTEIDSWTFAAAKCDGKEKASTLLDISKDFINKAKDLYPNCVEDDCGQKEKSSAFLDVAMNLISEVEKGYPTCNTTLDVKCPDPELPKYVEKPMDCSDILRSGKNKSGVYTIWPRSRIFTNKSLTVYCDMDTDGGGWTVIQRRGKFSTPKDYFYKDWDSYKRGFGNITEEFWIGNDNIFAISNQANYTIRFDLKNSKGETGYAEYNTFWIEDESASYTLHIEGFSGNAGDSMGHHDKRKFSTKDRKNDERSKNSQSCAVEYQGAWWYGDCTGANLNGLYQPGVDSLTGITWYYWGNKKWMGLSEVEIKLRFQ